MLVACFVPIVLVQRFTWEVFYLFLETDAFCSSSAAAAAAGLWGSHSCGTALHLH